VFWVVFAGLQIAAFFLLTAHHSPLPATRSSLPATRYPLTAK